MFKTNKILTIVAVLSSPLLIQASVFAQPTSCPTLSPSDFPQKGIGSFCDNVKEPFYSPNSGYVILRIKSPEGDGSFEYCGMVQIISNNSNIMDGDVTAIKRVSKGTLRGDKCTYSFLFNVRGGMGENWDWSHDFTATYTSSK